MSLSLLPGGRGGGSRFQLPEPPVVVDVGCSCRTPRLLSSLVASLKSRARGLRGGCKPNKSSPHASSSAWSRSSTTATAAFTPSANSTTTASSLLDHATSSWGLATYAANNGNTFLYEADAAAAAADDAESWRQERRRRRRRRRRQRSRCGRREEEEEEGGSCGAFGEETAVAVEVESAAPYEAFRESMVAMVTEKEMYAWEDLNALLHQFLALNSPRHHPLILGAFADLWAPRGGLFCPPSPCLLL